MPLDTILSQFHPTSILPIYLRSVSDPVFQETSHNNSISIPCLVILVTGPAHYSLLNFTILTTLADFIQIKKFLHILNPELLTYITLLRSKHFPEQFLLKHLKVR